MKKIIGDQALGVQMLNGIITEDRRGLNRVVLAKLSISREQASVMQGSRT